VVKLGVLKASASLTYFSQSIFLRFELYVVHAAALSALGSNAAGSVNSGGAMGMVLEHALMANAKMAMIEYGFMIFPQQ
jgi:hypothetical protein